MNRKAEGIGNLVAITRARIRGDLEALGAHGKSLEALTREEFGTMTLEAWNAAKELGERAQEESTTCLRTMGFTPSLDPGDASGSRVLTGGAVKRASAAKAGARAGGKKSAAARRAAIERATLVEPEEADAPEDPKVHRGEVVAADGGIPGAARRGVRQEADG